MVVSTSSFMVMDMVYDTKRVVRCSCLYTDDTPTTGVAYAIPLVINGFATNEILVYGMVAEHVSVPDATVLLNGSDKRMRAEVVEMRYEV